MQQTQHQPAPPPPREFFLAIKEGRRVNVWVKCSRLTLRNEPRFIVTRPHSSYALYLSDDIEDIRQWIKGQACPPGGL